MNFRESLWIHCKNLQSMEYLIKTNLGFTFFWHQTDDYTLTSNGFIWTYPGKITGAKSILVHLSEPDYTKIDFNKKIAGICSDYVTKFS
jgi:hypothetical protein